MGHRLLWSILLLLSSHPALWCQSTAEQRLQELLARARQSDRPQPWASLLTEADSEAVIDLERPEPSPCGDTRSVKTGAFGGLHYRWNALQRSENYEHDLLRRVVRELRGTLPGADALVALLRLGPYGGPWFNDDEFLPDELTEMSLHRRIVSILGSPSWQELKDARLTQIQSEAYETWWSLSRAQPDNPEPSQSGANASDHSRGADLARRKAVELYENILATRDDPDLRVRVAELRRRRDTHQPAWFRVGD